MMFDAYLPYYPSIIPGGIKSSNSFVPLVLSALWQTIGISSLGMWGQ